MYHLSASCLMPASAVTALSPTPRKPSLWGPKSYNHLKALRSLSFAISFHCGMAVFVHLCAENCQVARQKIWQQKTIRQSLVATARLVNLFSSGLCHFSCYLVLNLSLTLLHFVLHFAGTYFHYWMQQMFLKWHFKRNGISPAKYWDNMG